MRVFVTGGTGNIGQNVTLELLKRGHQVVLYTRTPGRIPAFQTMDGVTVCQGDILEHDKMAKGMEGCDAVVHIALGWGNDPVEILENDTRVTCFLMQEAERQHIGKMIYTSSTAAMGSLQFGIGVDSYLVPDDLYGATKASSEKFLLGFNQFYDGQGVYGAPVGLKRNIIRPGYTFSDPQVEGGASQSDTRFLDICKSLLQNQDLTFADTNGTQFISGRQIALLYADLLESDLNKEIFLALGTRFVSWAEIAQWAKEMIPGCTANIIVEKSGREPTYYDVSKMEKVFGLSFLGDEDLKDHVAWNLERARKILAGEEVHDVYHVW